MPFFAFLGCDGSGKTAVIRKVSGRLQEMGHSVFCGHWRPKPFAKPDDRSRIADAPHAQSPRGPMASILKLLWLWINWWIAWFQSLRSQSRNGIVIFDRFHADLIVDPTRYRYGGPIWLAELASRLMPRPDRVFFLDATPDVLMSRKQEVSYESLQESRSAYLNLKSTIPGFIVVDASQPLESVVDFILEFTGYAPSTRGSSDSKS